MMLSCDAFIWCQQGTKLSKALGDRSLPHSIVGGEAVQGRAVRKGLVWLGCWSSDVIGWLINVSAMRKMLELMSFLCSRGFFLLNSLLFMMKYLCCWPHLIMCLASNFVKCGEIPVLIWMLQCERAVPCAAKWSSWDMAGAGGNRQLGSEQVEFSYNRFYFVLLNDFVEETKISLVSAYPVCIVFTACSFLSSPPPLSHTHKKMLFWIKPSLWYYSRK